MRASPSSGLWLPSHGFCVVPQVSPCFSPGAPETSARCKSKCTRPFLQYATPGRKREGKRQERQRGEGVLQRVVSRSCSQLLANAADVLWDVSRKACWPHGRDLSVQSSLPLVKVGFAGHQDPCTSRWHCLASPAKESRTQHSGRTRARGATQ